MVFQVVNAFSPAAEVSSERELPVLDRFLLFDQMLEGEVECEDVRKKRAEPPLVSGVIQEQGFLTCLRRTELSPACGIPDGDRQRTLGRAIGDGRDANPTADERSNHREKARMRALNIAPILAVGCNVRESIQHFDSRHFNVFEPHPTVIHTVQPHF